MQALFDIGNTHTHVAFATGGRIGRMFEVPTAEWELGGAAGRVLKQAGRRRVESAAICSVVPMATGSVVRFLEETWKVRPFQLTHRVTGGLKIDYPRPSSIGPDRLANAIAALSLLAPPLVVVDFGTAVTFDVVDRRGCYVGGIIAPGLAAMTDYLHEKTALLPRIRIRREPAVIGRSTRQAMRIGAIHGYRGLVRELIRELARELGVRRLPVLATGGYASLIADQLSEIDRVEPKLTLAGLLRASRCGTMGAWSGADPGAGRDP
ncbi:MAG: type III pantothenate kinase [Verrucomicrobia bacterium]|nr:type III pantothenate kinase [Verrucomicrobiota bacterium]